MEKAFQALKLPDVLVHFDPGLKLLLACHASAYGNGAVLSHKMPDGPRVTHRFHLVPYLHQSRDSMPRLSEKDCLE